MSELDAVLKDLKDKQVLVAKKLAEDPLPQSETEARTRLQGEIASLGLAEHIVDLEMQGYTVLPPGKAAPAAFTERLRDAILAADEERKARSQKSALEATGTDLGAGRSLFHLMGHDPVFQEAVCNPTVLALVTYLAGYRAKLFTTTGLVKTNESDVPLYWHTDTGGRIPQPWGTQPLGANVNWILTDYTRENGCLCVVPGSHNLARMPNPAMPHDSKRVKLVEAPAGSVVVWHYNLWHAAVPRTAPGTRVTYVTSYDRPHLNDFEAYSFTTTPEMIERNPARFGVLMGLTHREITREEGPDPLILGLRPPDMGRWA